MSYTRSIAYSKVAVGILGLALLACSDPTTPRRLALTQHTAKSLVSAVAGGTITIADPDGTSFTLDPAAAEIRVSNDVVIDLRQEDVPLYVNGFMDIAVADSISNQLAVSPPTGEGHGGPCGALPCEERPGFSGALQAAMLETSTFSCAEIASNILAAAAAYRDSRPTLLGVLKEGVLGAAPFIHIDAASWALGTGAAVATYFVGHSYDRLTLQINVAMYRMNYCSEIHYTEEPFSGTDFGGGLTLDCSSQMMHVDFPQGPWEGWVTTCVYRMA